MYLTSQNKNVTYDEHLHIILLIEFNKFTERIKIFYKLY